MRFFYCSFIFWRPIYKFNSNETHLKVLSWQRLWLAESWNWTAWNSGYLKLKFPIKQLLNSFNVGQGRQIKLVVNQNRLGKSRILLYHTVLFVYHLVELHRRCSRQWISSWKFVAKKWGNVCLIFKIFSISFLPW